MPAVVTLSREGRVAVVRMEERETSNALSQGLLAGLISVFGEIARDESVHAVVVHGYDSVFSSGARREELLEILDRLYDPQRQEGPQLFRLFLECEVPVIAAMQGHAIGGGLLLGLYADVPLFAEESLYSTNFVEFGFPPSGGATVVVPAKLGPNLAHEMLFSARRYHGGELRARGAPITVLKRKEVIPAALRLAADIAANSRTALRLLKRQLSAPLLGEMPEAIRRETREAQAALAQPGVRERLLRGGG